MVAHCGMVLILGEIILSKAFILIIFDVANFGLIKITANAAKKFSLGTLPKVPVNAPVCRCFLQKSQSMWSTI